MKTAMFVSSLLLSGCLAFSPPARPEDQGRAKGLTQERANTHPGNQRTSTDCGGSLLARTAKKLTPGSYVELPIKGFTDELDFDGYANTVFGYTYEAFWDPTTCRVLFIGGGHGSLTKFLTYSASDNLWTQAPDPYFLCPIRDGEDVAWGRIGHAYGFQGMDADRGVFYYVFADGNVYGIDTDPSLSNQWKRVGIIPQGVTYSFSSMEYFPELKRLVLVSSDKLSLLDPVSGECSFIEGPFPMGEYHHYAVYNPVHTVMLFGSGNGSSVLHKLNAQARVTRIVDAPRQFHPQSDDDATFKILTYDPVSGDYLAYASSGELYSHDVALDRWSQVDTRLPASAFVAAVDPRLWGNHADRSLGRQTHLDL